jgi:multidrug resistance efflux pump
MVLHENTVRLNGHSANHFKRGRILLAAFAIGIAILLPSFFWRFFEETRQANLHQQQVYTHPS